MLGPNIDDLQQLNNQLLTRLNALLTQNQILLKMVLVQNQNHYNSTEYRTLERAISDTSDLVQKLVRLP